MPTPELMTWVPAQKRWTKRYRGRRYYVSARQLGTAETKDASLHAANQWWRDKQADVEVAYRAGIPELRTPQPLEDMAAASLGTADLAAAIRASLHALTCQNPFPSSETASTLTAGDGLEAVIAAEVRRVVGGLVQAAILSGDPLPDALRENLPPARAHQLERAIQEMRGDSTADPNRTVSAKVEVWCDTHRALSRAGGVSPMRYRNVKIHVGHFAAFLGESADVSTLDAEQLAGFHRYCLAKIADGRQGVAGGWSTDYAKEVFLVARRFARWLVEQDAIPAPRNLDSRNFRFGSTSKRVLVWTTEEVQTAISKATGPLKLALLLMVNCGMTQGDVSDLLDSEVNWRDGRIVRRRSKTASRDSVPVVDYKLWPQTFALLKQHRSGSDRVLLTKSGRPFVNTQLIGDTVRAVDSFKSLYRRLKERTGFKKPMKQLRKTSASLLESHEVYGRLTSLFLGHAPVSVKDRHYAAPPRELFDAAIMWIGGQLGVAE